MLTICFLAGLPEHYQKKLRETPGLTYEQAQLHARQFKAAEQFETARYSAQPVCSSTTSLDKEEIASVKAQLAALTLCNPVSLAGRETPIKQETERRTNAARPVTQPYRTQTSRNSDFISEQTDWKMRERITIKFNDTNAVALGILSMNALASFAYQIAIIETEIGPIRAIKSTIAGIAIVETIELMILIRADMMTRVIEKSTVTEMTNVEEAIGTADTLAKTAQTPLIAIETVDDKSYQHLATTGATHRIQIFVVIRSSTRFIQLRNFWNFT